MATETVSQDQVWTLPPLILHPFSDANGPGQLVESSRASLILQGLLPGGGQSQEDLDQKLLTGRYCELRMLFYVGKDLIRWIEQCMELVERTPELLAEGVKPQSFANLLVFDPPPLVAEKLKKWGVVDYKGIFSRAIGINSMFNDPPSRIQLADDFLRNYYRYADYLFAGFQSLAKFTELNPKRFEFTLYASGEYTRMLEREWEEL